MTGWLQRLTEARERGVLAPDEFWIVLLGTTGRVCPDRIVASVLGH